MKARELFHIAGGKENWILKNLKKTERQHGLQVPLLDLYPKK
jgi:hypothetical protein